MKKHLQLIIVCLIAGIVSIQHAVAQQQVLSTNADTEMLAKRFAQSIVKGDFVNGAREMSMFSIMDSATITRSLNQLPDVLAAHVIQNGPLTDVDLLSTHTRGKSFVRHAYALKSQRGALRCVVVFYKASKGWAVQSYTIDSRIAEEIED
jgi:hypothetical protein